MRKLVNIIAFLLIILSFSLLMWYFFTPTANVVREIGEIQACFCPDEMCKEKLIEFIEKSEEIKCAFYQLNIPEIIFKLEEKKAEVIIEDSNKMEQFLTGYSEALMHNKFCIFDNKLVFTGSMNPTINDNYFNNNNIVIIKSDTLAKNYLDEFYELKNNIYGKGEKTKNPIIDIGFKLENYFCPEDNCKLHVINALKKANKSIYFMVFSFTDKDIGNLIWNKQKEGVDVKGIYDESQISDFSTYTDLKDFSIIDKNKYKLHHKVFIIDEKIVITGSYNPSRNANERNDENLIIIYNEDIAKKYLSEFNKLWNYKDKIPNTTKNIALSKIIYNPLGKDQGNEIIEIINLGYNEVLLDYYSISDNKTTMRLNGTIKDKITINPKFSLKNKNGLLLLRHNSEIIDYVEWENNQKGQLIREDFKKVSNEAWN